MRQGNVESDRRCSVIRGPSICSLHQSRSAARRNYVLVDAALRSQCSATLGGNSSEPARLGIPIALPPWAVFANASAAKHNKSRTHHPGAQVLFGFGVL